MAKKPSRPANPLETSPAREHRIRERAYHLWESEGRPHGRHDEFWERAEALIGMEDSAGSGQIPATSSAIPHPIEEADIQDNLGEFPGQLTDQGDTPPTPRVRKPRAATAEPPATPKAAPKAPRKAATKAPAGKAATVKAPTARPAARKTLPTK